MIMKWADCSRSSNNATDLARSIKAPFTVSGLCPQMHGLYAFWCFFLVSRITNCLNRGVAIGGSGGSDEPPHGPGKVRKNRFFSFFSFLSGFAQESVFVETDERTPPTENKSCKTRHGQVNVRMALRPNAVAAKENQP